MTYNIELDSKPNRFGFYDVLVRLHKTGQLPARINTGVKIESIRHWALQDKKQKERFKWGKWVFGSENSDALNAKIKEQFNHIEETVEKWQKEELDQNPELTESTLTPKDAAARYKNRLSDRYFDLATQALEEAKEGAFRTFSLKQTAVNSFAKFAGDDLTLQNVNAQLIEKYQKYLKSVTSEKTGKKLKPTSINQYIESLGKVHKDVLKLKGHSNRKAALMSPFPDVDALPTKNTYRSKFNEQEIETIRTSDVASTRR